MRFHEVPSTRAPFGSILGNWYLRRYAPAREKAAGEFAARHQNCPGMEKYFTLICVQPGRWCSILLAQLRPLVVIKTGDEREMNSNSSKARSPDMRAIQLEICTASVEDCVKAERGGADRVELNCALMLGGLTPTLGALREARAAVRLPIIAMIRPRPAGFCYSPAEFAVMQRDAEAALSEKADGIAFGILTAAGAVDVKRCRQMVKLTAGRQAVFHRAFDVVRDPLRALEQLIDLGLTRVMTSGQEASAYNGAANIAAYIRQAAGRIEILPAGGINRFTVADVIRRTSCNQVHASLSTTGKDSSASGRPQVSFGGAVKQSEEQFTVTDAQAVRRLRDLLAE